MSYILDALRRADSERERGAVPGVHAQALPPGPADLDAPPPPRLWPAVSVVLGVLLAAALGWQFFGGGTAPPPAPVAAAVPRPVVETPPEPPAVAPASAVAPAPAVAAVAPAPARVAASKAASPARPAVVARPPAAAARPEPPPAPAAAPPVRPAPALPPPPVVAVAPRPEPPARIPLANELPDDLQRGLPTLQVGGASYSQNAESRMLIVNGQVYREGDRLPGDVTLEQIRLKEAVLSVRGTRYRIAY